MVVYFVTQPTRKTAEDYSESGSHVRITVGNSSQGVNCFTSIQLTYMGVVCVIIEGMRFFLVFFG